MSNYSKQLPSYNDIFGKPNTKPADIFSKPIVKPAANNPKTTKYEKKPEIKPVISPKVSVTQKISASAPKIEDYNDDHFKGHEEECEVCDYIEMFQNMDRNEFKKMFVFSEIIGKPKSLRKR